MQYNIFVPSTGFFSKIFTYMAYCTVKCVSSGVPFPGTHCSVFLKFTEEKMTLMGLGGAEETEEEKRKLRFRRIRDTCLL